MPPSGPNRPCPPRRRALLVCAAIALTPTIHAQPVDIKIGGSGAGLGTMAMLGQAFAATHPGAPRVTVHPSMGSGGGIKAVLAGAIQVAVSSRPPTAAEVAAGAVAVVYGRTPFVMATASTNPVSALSAQQLADYYAGKVGAWPDGTKLRLVLRPIGDTDSEILKRISPAMRDAKSAAEQRKGLVMTVTDQETASALEKIPGALGPSTLALLLSEKRALKALALDGVAPSAETLANGRYPHAKQMLLVTGPKSPPQAQAFIEFVRSPAGRVILKQTGHWVP